METVDKNIGTCRGKCKEVAGRCPNAKSYSDLSKRNFHSEVKCNKCGDKWLWGLSWDGSMDGEFVCPDCEKLLSSSKKCVIEGCIKPATVEVQDLDYKGNRTWFCENHANSFEDKEKYLETEINQELKK